MSHSPEAKGDSRQPTVGVCCRVAHPGWRRHGGDPPRAPRHTQRTGDASPEARACERVRWEVREVGLLVRGGPAPQLVASCAVGTAAVWAAPDAARVLPVGASASITSGEWVLL